MWLIISYIFVIFKKKIQGPASITRNLGSTLDHFIPYLSKWYIGETISGDTPADPTVHTADQPAYLPDLTADIVIHAPYQIQNFLISATAHCPPVLTIGDH